MKRSMTVIIVLAVLAAGGAAWAAGTTTVNVSATVTPVCKFNNTGSISFTLDPSAGGNVNGFVIQQPTISCTKGEAYTITDDLGNNDTVAPLGTRKMKHASLAEYIPYSFTYTAAGTGNGAGVGNEITMNIASAVMGTDYVNASAGSYLDTVTLTINP